MKGDTRPKRAHFKFSGRALTLGQEDGRWFSEDEYNQIIAVLDGSLDRVAEAEAESDKLREQLTRYKDANIKLVYRIRSMTDGDFKPPQVVDPNTPDRSKRIQDRPLKVESHLSDKPMRLEDLE